MSRAALGVGLGIFGAAGVGALVMERRAAKNLDRMIRIVRRDQDIEPDSAVICRGVRDLV
jgi:hypothetical protein